jgi:hypothetical protein
MSVVQVFVGSQMAVVAHLVNADTIGREKNLQLDDEARLFSKCLKMFKIWKLTNFTRFLKINDMPILLSKNNFCLPVSTQSVASNVDKGQ